jgi:hypothetical protein
MKRPTPAMVVAVLALVAAATGTAIASQSKQHKGHSDAAKDRALMKKLAPGLSVKFARSAGTAATATSATSADHATSATSADSAASAANADKLGGLTPDQFERAGHLVSIAVRMSNTDPDKTLLSAGPFTIKGHCAAQNAQQNLIMAFATTSENDAAIHGHDLFGTEGGDADFDVGDQQTLGQYQEGGTPPNPAGPFPSMWSMSAPSGAQVSLTLTLATRVFSDNASQRVACVFGGYAVVS